MSTVFVAVTGETPFAASADLGLVQSVAVERESQYDRESREFRWDEVVEGERWMLSARNARTGRWNRTYKTIHAVPTVDAATSEETQR